MSIGRNPRAATLGPLSGQPHICVRGAPGPDTSPLQEADSALTDIKVSAYISGGVSTDIPSCNRNRPEELQNNPATYEDVLDNESRMNMLRKNLDTKMTIEKSADILFKGLLDDRLYIGFLGFREQHPYFPGMLIERTSNIINERNPIIP